MTDLNLVSSLLFTPGNRIDRFAKALATGADGLIIDLEDAVAPADKDSARSAVLDWLRTAPAKPHPDFLFCLRINSVFTGYGLLDLAAVVAAAREGVTPDALLLPKVESAVEVELVARHLKQAGAPQVALVALIESAVGLEAAPAIARASSMVKAMAFGGADLAADLRATFGWEPLYAARARVVQAAAMGGIAAIDVPYLQIDNEAGLTEECARVRAMGFGGKLAIHPSQVAPINTAFTPTAAEVDYANGVAAAYEAAAGGVCTYRGKMIDEPVMASARRVLARSKRGAA